MTYVRSSALSWRRKRFYPFDPLLEPIHSFLCQRLRHMVAIAVDQSHEFGTLINERGLIDRVAEIVSQFIDNSLPLSVSCRFPVAESRFDLLTFGDIHDICGTSRI